MEILYYTSKDTRIFPPESFTPSWRSLCHNQPNMENVAIFLDIANGDGAFGICRRCGKESELVNVDEADYSYTECENNCADWNTDGIDCPCECHE
jgi:hypothetical protein